MPARYLVTSEVVPAAPPVLLADQGDPQEVPLARLTRSPYNPVGRTDDVKSLAKSLVADGQLEEVHAVRFPDGSLVLADGHCRHEAALLAGLAKLWVRIYTPADGQTADELLSRLYVALAQNKKTLKAGQMLNTALQGGPTFNSGVRGAHHLVWKLFSEQEIRDILVPAKVTPTLLNTAKRTTAYVLPDIGKDTATFENRVRNHILYFIRRQDAQQAANIYVRRGYDPKALKAAIDANKPIPRLMAKDE